MVLENKLLSRIFEPKTSEVQLHKLYISPDITRDQMKENESAGIICLSHYYNARM
jgi:hypothetical protein